MSVALFCEGLELFPASRARQLAGQAAIECVYALVWPDYAAPNPPRPQQNRAAYEAWRHEARIPLWAWFNASPDQAADAEAIARLDAELSPDGWLLDIEGPWTEGAGLATLLSAAAKTGRPCRASLAGASPSLAEYDYRELERQGFEIDWQAYLDSGEGPHPAEAVSELYAATFVIPGWQYRHRVGAVYGWGRVKAVQESSVAIFDSYLRPGQGDALFGVLPREFGWTVDDRILWPANPDRPPIGLLMGRTAYPKIRVTLDVTRGFAHRRTLAEWSALAASARIAGSRKRSVSIYLAENAPDDVVVSIAEGSA